MQFPVIIRLHRSRSLFVLLVSFHALAFGCVFFTQWPWFWRLLLLGMILCSAVFSLLRPSRNEIAGFRIDSKQNFECLSCGEDYIPCDILAGSTVFRRLVVLRLRVGKTRRVTTQAVFEDQMSADEFRMLRLWLRWRAEPRTGVGMGF